MKRRFFALLFVLAAAFALTAPAAADVIWEPADAFYASHQKECTYVDRRYELAGYDGTVTVWDAPGGTVKETLSNGRQVTVQFRWAGTGGVAWGYVYGYSDSRDDGGWVPMDDLTLVYDSQQFMEDHADEIVTGGPVSVDFHSAVLYNYPGGLAGRVIDEYPDYLPFSELFSTVYTDESGPRWGYVDYYMGHVNGWVCLDDPMNEHLDTKIVPVSPSAAQLRGSETVTPGSGRQLQLILAGVLVAAAVVATAFAIRKVRPGKKPTV